MFCITFDNFGCGSQLGPCPFPEIVPTVEWEHYNEIGLHVGHPRILQLLRQLHIRTTYFAEGYAAVLHPQEMKRWCDEGHEIALHGWKHEMWTKLPSEQKEDELVTLAIAAMRDLLDEAPLGFRPPGMRINPWTDEVLSRHGIQYIAQITESRKDPRFAKLGIDYSDEEQDILITRRKILVCSERRIDGDLISPAFGGFFGDCTAEEAYDIFCKMARDHEEATPDKAWTFIIHPHISGNRAWPGLEKFLRRLHANFGEGAFKMAREVVQVG